METDQHKIDSGTFNWKAYKDNEIYTGKNFATVDWKSDITWHYDKISNTVIVTNVDITLTNIPATAKANGFWDALIFFNPNKELPEGEGSYDYRQTPDLPGINGDSLYNQIGANNPSNGILAYYAHNNDTGAYTIKLSLNNTVPYSAEKVNSNTYRLVRTALRKNNHNASVGKGAINDVVWKNGSIDILVSLPEKPDVPTKPTLKTTEVSYHHDVMTVNPPTLAQSRVTPQYHDLFSQTDVQKHYSENNIQTDNKLYIAGDTAHADVSVKLLNASDYEGGLNKLSFDDDYSNFASHAKVNVDQSKVTHDGQDITSDFTITDNGNGHVTATAKDPSKFTAGIYTFTPSWTINTDTATDTILKNQGSITVNTSTGEVPPVQVPVYKPDPSKHFQEGKKVVDSMTYISGDTAHGWINVPLPDPDELAKPLTEFSITDNFSKSAKYLSYDSSQVLVNGKDDTQNWDVKVEGTKLVATAKNPGKLPAGNIALIANFVISKDTPSDTTIYNEGSATMNKVTVPTNTPTVQTYRPTDNKHWVEGQDNHIVDDHSFIAGDNVNGLVSLTTPIASTLAKPLTKVQVADDFSNFADKADYKSAYVTVNGKQDNDWDIQRVGNTVVATAKNPGSVPAGMVQLHVTWTAHKGLANNTAFINSGSGTINNLTIETPKRTIKTYTQNPDKHWVEGQDHHSVDDKLVVNGDNISALVTGTLPDQSTLTKKLEHVQLVDDYSNFADKADVATIVLTENGKDAQDLYTVTNENGKVTATRKDASTAPAGIVQMAITWKLHKDVANGTKLQNNSSELLNNNSVDTKTVTVTTYKPDPNKHWQEGSLVVDGKTYVDGDTVHADVFMPLPNPTDLAKPLEKVSLTEDFNKFAQYADYLDSQVFVNGKDVSSDWDIQRVGNTVVATAKNPGKLPGGVVYLHNNFNIKLSTPSGTTLLNNGSGTINNTTVAVPERPIKVYKTDVTKHWTLDNTVTDNQIYMSGTQATATMTVNTPTNLATPLTKFSIDDDFSNYAQYVTANQANVKVMENDQDATSQYDIKIDNNGHVIATRKDASKTPEGKVQLIVTFDIKNGVKTGTVFINNGSATVNKDTESVPPTKVVVWTPDPTKDVGLNQQSGKIQNSVNGQNVAKGTTLTYGLTTDDVPANRAQKITSRSIVDTLDSKAQYLGYKAFIKGADGKLVDVTEHINLTQDGQKLTFDEDSYLLDRYNQDLTKSVDTPIIDLFVSAQGDGSDIKNSYDLYTNGVKTTSNTVENKTPNAPKPVKEDLNEKGVNIDGKNMLPGDTNVFKVNADYSDYKGVQASDDSIAKGFYIIDDFPEDALDVDTSKFIAVDSKGQTVKGMSYKVYKSLSEAPAAVQAAVAKSGIKLNGSFIVASADDPASYFKQYVQTGDSVSIKMPMVVKDAFNGEYKNAAYQFDFGNGYATNIVSNKVPKINPTKDVVISVDNQKSLNNSNIKLNQNFDYKLTGAMLPANEGNPITQYGFQDDYDQVHDQYNGQYSVLLDTDVTLTDGTVLKKGTDVTKYTTQVIDTENGAVDVEFDKDFLAKVDIDKSAFGASVYLNMKRVKAGDVTNKYTNIINGKKYVSNTVKTHTDEPKKPETPKTPTPSLKPETPQPAQPKVETPAQPVIAAVTPAPVQPKAEPQQELPQTGNDSSQAAAAGFVGLLLALGSFGLKRKKDFA
ncbi:LPXTG cell wall anchor domain-containing protein [Limosilactobacillus vaginalis]|uniref:SspB-related isopeptide-forming adhesin n=1 Tax=Limosilactobacillus vaginalis TaxID=1633 RepID=UPI0021B56BFD|nr:SspB-related isopeptide-forming adhesin [Limosilactobacillus vaginalis]UXC69768.1 LPXTG cell wall anchor domain-containing protein [Limosilactobacillus vaginalis]